MKDEIWPNLAIETKTFSYTLVYYLEEIGQAQHSFRPKLGVERGKDIPNNVVQNGCTHTKIKYKRLTLAMHMTDEFEIQFYEKISLIRAILK